MTFSNHLIIAPHMSSLRTWKMSIPKPRNHKEASYFPSGRYRLTTRGIFFSLSSLIAICNGSVSPSRSTRTGAFMLKVVVCQHSWSSPMQSLRRQSSQPPAEAFLKDIPLELNPYSDHGYPKTYPKSLQRERTNLICSALVPNTLALSYFVMYGVVDLSCSGIFFAFNPSTAFFFPCCC